MNIIIVILTNIKYRSCYVPNGQHDMSSLHSKHSKAQHSSAHLITAQHSAAQHAQHSMHSTYMHPCCHAHALICFHMQSYAFICIVMLSTHMHPYSPRCSHIHSYASITHLHGNNSKRKHTQSTKCELQSVARNQLESSPTW